MDGPSRLHSVFDKYDKLENPSSSFTWELPPSTLTFSKSDLICTGSLQEIEAVTSAIHSTKYYAATSTHLLRFLVRNLALRT
jgi:hypothetical protein